MKIDLTDYPKYRNPHTGRFLKNSIPHNKGKSWSEWMDGRKKRKILKNLQHKGNPNLAGANAKTIVGVKNGKFCVFESSEDAGRKLEVAVDRGLGFAKAHFKGKTTEEQASEYHDKDFGSAVIVYSAE